VGEFAHETSTDKPFGRGGRRVARGLWLVYLVVLAIVAFPCYRSGQPLEWLKWHHPDEIWIVQVLSSMGLQVAVQSLLVLLLGFLTGASLATTVRPSRMLDQVIDQAVRLCLGVLVSFAIAVAFRRLVAGEPFVAPSFLSVAMIAGGCLWGAWLGTTWIGARSTWRWLLRQATLAAICLVGGIGALLYFSTSDQPLPIDSTPASTADRRRLVAQFREHDPRKLAPDETMELTVSERDINQLAHWAFSLLPGEHAAEFRLSDDRLAAQLSLELPRLPCWRPYLNLVSSGSVIARDGELGYLPREVRLGQVAVPRALLAASGPMVVGRVWRNEATDPFFQSLKEIRLGNQLATISYGHLDVERGFAHHALVGLGVLEDLEASVHAQVTRLIVLTQRDDSLTFGQCLETAFDEASKRSLDGTAARENRAAILALGYVLGHFKLRPLLGRSIPALDASALRKFGRVTLADRQDWTRHFSLSAALQVLANTAASKDAGVLKEELDAEGGSGFSFGDLLADRAGTMMAVRATSSESAARAMQKRLAAGFVESDFMPPGHDLPEGLSNEQFQAEYGGVGGPGFRQLLQEIDRRIAATAPVTER
jgi:hypothetical protein